MRSRLSHIHQEYRVSLLCCKISTSNSDHEPPGTFLLVRDDVAGETAARKVVMLDPVPSNDPNDPLKWSTTRKAVNFGLVLAVTAIIFTGLSIQIIFWQQMTVDLKVSYTQLNNSMSVNFVGLAVGCLLFIPLAKKFGRRPVYLVSTAIMTAMAFWTAEMNTLTELYITNLLFGLAGATNEAIVEITIADIAFVHHRGGLNGLYLVMVMIRSFLAPIASGAQATAQGWRWCYRTLSIINAAVLILFIFFYEETKCVLSIKGVENNTITETDASIIIGPDSKTSKSLPVSKTQTLEQPSTTHHSIDHTIQLNSWHKRLALITPTPEPIWPHFYRPLCILYYFPAVLFAGLQYASGVVWLTVTASVLGLVMLLPPYNFTPAQIGYMNCGFFVGNIFGSIYGGYLGDKAIVYFSRRNRGYFEPEMRLYLLHLPSFAMAGGVVMFGVSLAKGQHWIVSSIGGALFGYGLGAIGDASLTFVIDSYKDIAGDAFTGIAFLRNAISIGIPFAITPWMNADGFQNMSIASGFVSLAISALIIPMIIFGKRLRGKLAPRYRKYAGETRDEISVRS